jgi:hypothetical protein
MEDIKKLAEFQDAMIAYAKKIQGDNYPGDDYYRQGCWQDYFADGETAEDAVVGDMGYWE